MTRPALNEVDRALLAQDAFAAFRRLDGERQQVMLLAAQMMADKCFPLTMRDIQGLSLTELTDAVIAAAAEGGYA